MKTCVVQVCYEGDIFFRLAAAAGPGNEENKGCLPVLERHRVAQPMVIKEDLRLLQIRFQDHGLDRNLTTSIRPEVLRSAQNRRRVGVVNRITVNGVVGPGKSWHKQKEANEDASCNFHR